MGNTVIRISGSYHTGDLVLVERPGEFVPYETTVAFRILHGLETAKRKQEDTLLLLTIANGEKL